MSQEAFANKNSELLQIIDAVARDKNIDREAVIEAMEGAIQVAGRRKYGAEYDVRAEMDRKTGVVKLFQVQEVVESLEEGKELHQITLLEARRKDASLNVGDLIRTPLPPIDFGRVAAQNAKQVIIQKVKDTERQKQFDQYQDKVGTIVNGVVKRVEYGDVFVEIAGAEAVLRKNHVIPRENFKVGDRVRSVILSVKRERSAPQILLSRTAPEFMIGLFAQEVPEIFEGIIEIRSAARDAGSRAKMTVFSHDPSIDPVGSCVGVRGSRVQAVVGEMQGERVDIIPWNDDIASLVVNALTPAEVSKVVMDEDNNKIEVIVPEDQLSLAIGRRGQNVNLASQLTGLNIDIMTEEQESKRRTEEFIRLSAEFAEALDLEEVMAQLLVAEGFESIEQIAFVPVSDLAEIDGFDEDIAEELRTRAREHLQRKETEIEQSLIDSGVDKELFAIDGLSREMLLKLSKHDIKTLDDLADLAGDELVELLAPKIRLDLDMANAIIMKARAHWFDE